MAEEYTAPAFVKNYLTNNGYVFPCSEMESRIDAWKVMLDCKGDFWNYQDVDAEKRKYKVHRKTIHPARRVVNEWASLILDEGTEVNCKEEKCTEWLTDFYQRINFKSKGQELVSDAFGLGTAAWVLWFDGDDNIQVRRNDARMIFPLSWDDDGISECAFSSRVFIGGKQFDQLQLHVKEGDTYRIKTVVFDKEGKPIPEFDLEQMGIVTDWDTESETPYFAIVKPAIKNTVADCSPYGQSVFEDAIDVMKSVDSCYDTIMNEVDLGKLRLFLSDMMFEVDNKGGKTRAIPFGKDDNIIFRKVMSSKDDNIYSYAPSLRTADQVRAYRLALKTMGDLCGFGLSYFDIDDAGGIKTATEVSSDNSALMRNIKKHENSIEGAICQISRAVLHCARTHMGESLPDEGEITVRFDDSIIEDTAAEKARDLAEVGLTMAAYEYRMKWYGEDEKTAKAKAAEVAGPAPAEFIEE